MVQGSQSKIDQRRRVGHRTQHALASVYNFSNLETIPGVLVVSQHLVSGGVKIKDCLRLVILGTSHHTPDEESGEDEKDYDCWRYADTVEYRHGHNDSDHFLR